MTAKKYTRKRDARAQLLFFLINPDSFFKVNVVVTFVVAKVPYKLCFIVRGRNENIYHTSNSFYSHLYILEQPALFLGQCLHDCLEEQLKKKKTNLTLYQYALQVSSVMNKVMQFIKY